MMTLKKTQQEMKEQFPAVTFRAIGVDLSKPDHSYMSEIIKECKGITPTLIFNNAGYILTGHFADTTLAEQTGNYECNATAPVYITHHFANQMLDQKLKGAIFFTSSPAGFMPCPITVMYGATKAFLTEFATSIGPELRGSGIDVLVVHPSPVNTSFYKGNKHNIQIMEFFRGTATTPERIANCFFRAVGRTAVYDQGYYSFWLRIVLRLIDLSFLQNIIYIAGSSSGELTKIKKKRPLNK